MAWLTKDKDGTETIWTLSSKPIRLKNEWVDSGEEDVIDCFTNFPDGTFKNCPSWEDEPIEI